MSSEYKTILAEVFCDILMKYAFMFGDASPKDELPTNGSNYLRAAIDFSGYRSGTLEISTSTELCAELAANVLGIEPDDDNSVDNSSDALEEFINVVCGQFLTTAFGDAPVFDLSPPSVLEIGETEWKSILSNEEAIGFIIEDAPAIMNVYVNQKTEADSGSDCG